MRLFLYIFILLLASCSLQEQSTPYTFTDFEYQIGDNEYIAFTKRHFYRVWYSGTWTPTAQPSLQCIGRYTYSVDELTLNYYESSEAVEYTIQGGSKAVGMSCGADCAEVWIRTKVNHYIR